MYVFVERDGASSKLKSGRRMMRRWASRYASTVLDKCSYDEIERESDSTVLLLAGLRSQPFTLIDRPRLELQLGIKIPVNERATPANLERSIESLIFGQIFMF